MTDEFLQQIEAIVTNLGYECVHIGIKKDFGRTRVQILIDTLGGINIDDCETVSRRVNKFLDENQDATELERYYLEVSSPGVERPLYKLEDYVRFQGREARIRINGQLDGGGGRKTFTGFIKSVENKNICLICKNGTEEIEKSIPFDLIKGANLVFRFGNENEKDEKQKQRRGKKRK
ncbi:MAG: ribosome maturation factor RimP [Synergistaceae bacterium]|nr:ribosome maturation factor RimP [Synergistaceae bacterium]